MTFDCRKTRLHYSLDALITILHSIPEIIQLKINDTKLMFQAFVRKCFLNGLGFCLNVYFQPQMVEV